MASPAVGQAEMLASEFEAILRSHEPKTVALVGCAGGNGFAEAAKARIARIVGIDINERYITDAKERYGGTIPGLELHCADIQGHLPADLEAVELIYAALVFEYVDMASALRNISRLCRPNGILAALLQLPKPGADAVTTSPFPSLKALSSIMRLVPPAELEDSAEAAGFVGLSRKTITLQSGKQFSLHLFRQTGQQDVI